MKKNLFTICTFLILFSAFDSVAELKNSRPNPPYAVARGFSNLMFGWLEIPRGIIYENSRIPVVGFVVGPIKGALLTTWRVLAGTVDVVAMGLTRKGLYNDQLPDFVWDASWIYSCEEDIVNVETLNSSSNLTEDMVTPKIIKKRERDKKHKKCKRGFNPKTIEKSCNSKKWNPCETNQEKYKTAVLCWKSSDKSSKKKSKFLQTNSPNPVPFNLDSDDEFLEALNQLKHHVENIEYHAKTISDRR